MRIGRISARKGRTASAYRPQSQAYVANNDIDTVSVIDTASHTVIAIVPVGDEPGFVDGTSDDAFAYVSISGTGAIFSPK